MWVERRENENKNNTVYAISDEPMSHEEWKAKFTKGN